MLEVPERMKGLSRDKRGYPVPFGVLIDNDGNPHFTINDECKRQEMIARDLCSICGQALHRGRWFVGGILSAFHPRGVFIDPPMHHECATYALQVCPYLAAPRYARRIDARTLDPAKVPGIVLRDNTMIEARPGLFVAAHARGQSFTGDDWQDYLRPTRPYIAVEYWRHGKRVGSEEAEKFVTEVLEAAQFK